MYSGLEGCCSVIDNTCFGRCGQSGTRTSIKRIIYCYFSKPCFDCFPPSIWISNVIYEVTTSSMVEQSLPKKLWGEPYIQPTPLEFIPVFFDDERTHAIFKIVAEVRRQESACPGIRVEGRNEQELATEFISQMKISVRSGDWSKILSPNRHFVW